MDLSNLKPAKGSVKKDKRLEGDRDPVRAEQLHVVIRDKNPDPDTQRELDLKVDKCHFSAVYPNMVSRTLTGRNIRRLIFPPLKSWPVERS